MSTRLRPDRKPGSRDHAAEELLDQELARLVASAPTELDLTSARQRAIVHAMAETLEETGASTSVLNAAEYTVSRDPSVPVLVRVAAKLALSRAMLAEFTEPLHISLVVAVYKEHQRILTAGEHPSGEDFLREKLRQMRWLFRSTPQHSWDLVGRPPDAARRSRGDRLAA